MALALEDPSPPAPAGARFNLAPPPALDSHLAECPECAGEWDRSRHVDSLLRLQTLTNPPAGFAHATVRRAWGIRRGPEPGLRPREAALVAGALLVLTAVASAWLRQHGTAVATALEAAPVAAQTLAASMRVSPTPGERLALQSSMAGLLAVLWFLAVAVPLRARGPRADITVRQGGRTWR
jgi:hypothetical protein